MGILLRTRRSQESRWSSEEPRRSSPARMKAELVKPGWERKDGGGQRRKVSNIGKERGR